MHWHSGGYGVSVKRRYPLIAGCLLASLAFAQDRFGISEAGGSKGSKLEELIIAGAFCGACLGVLACVWAMILGKSNTSIQGFAGVGAAIGAISLPIAYFLMR